MPAKGVIGTNTAEALRLHDAGLGCVEIGRRLGVTPKTVCCAVKRFRRDGRRVVAVTTDETADMSETELEAMIERQMRCKPAWWKSETPRETRQTQTPGRCAEPVKTKTGHVCRKGRR